MPTLRVAELPTCQTILHADAPSSRMICEPPLMRSAVPIWKVNEGAVAFASVLLVELPERKSWPVREAVVAKV